MSKNKKSLLSERTKMRWATLAAINEGGMGYAYDAEEREEDLDMDMGDEPEMDMDMGDEPEPEMDMGEEPDLDMGDEDDEEVDEDPDVQRAMEASLAPQTVSEVAELAGETGGTVQSPPSFRRRRVLNTTTSATRRTLGP